MFRKPSRKPDLAAGSSRVPAVPRTTLTRLTKVLCVVAVLMFALFSASAVRHFIPGLKTFTRSASIQRVVERDVQLMGAVEAQRVARPAGVPPRHVEVVKVSRPSHSWRPVRLIAPPSRASGAYALGTGSLPRSARWLVMGGHGRHGAG